MNRHVNTLVGNSKVLKGINRVRIMNCLRHGPASRAQLVRNTGLDTKTMTNICNELLADKLIVPKENILGQVGRPAQKLSINNEAAFAIGIDVKARQTTGLIVDLGGNIITRVQRSYDVPERKDFLLMEIKTVISELLDAVNLKTRKNIKGIGLSFPGLINDSAGVAIRSSTILCYKNLPIVNIIRKKFPFDVFLEGSNRAAALAEIWFGHETSDTFLCIHLEDYSIGMSVIENGILYRGTDGTIGISHTIVQPGGEKCICGRRGCLDTIASGRALAKKASKAGIISSDSEQAVTKAIRKSAESGNKKAQEILKQAGEYIGIGIANMIDIFSPEAIILNNELIDAGDMLIDPLKEVVTQHNRKLFDFFCEIKLSRIGTEAGALGASILPLRQFFEFENIQIKNSKSRA